MEYNMGWLVQAEAPPGALLRKFKQVVSAGQAKPEDVAFYFTHWFTDLAGAEPHPQDGPAISPMADGVYGRPPGPSVDL
ncbi:unnamed protein product [Prorocentrum cordatum]|uniref:Uncharacterized protein n=1 Tax=Prorocentrum cordatum TaxID=2364126 RepID=A0ABN9U2A2_9DINO|nr:unnamed protein product [Polarella glacialis]